jgi:uncharacterized membrane protein YkoI
MDMKSLTGFAKNRMLWKTIVPSFADILLLIFAASLLAQNCPANNGVRTICQQVGNAEVVSVAAPVGVSPDSQLEVYWHDDEWKIDMLPQFTADGAVRMKITSRHGDIKIVNFPNIFAQVNSITRNPEDKAIIFAEATGTVEAFLIADLKEGKLIDDIAIVAPSVSPDRRFILYVNTDNYDYYNYRLYDTSKSPRENTCGYRGNDPDHKDLDEGYRGFPIYPRKANQTSCSDAAEKAFADESHTQLSNFIWSADSSKAVFADVMNGSAISLILVTMPHGDKDKEHEGDHDRDSDLPRTLIYPLVGAENVCAGAATCDYNNVKSIAWNGNAVNVALMQANPGGKAIVKNLTIPLSKFVPVGK